MGIAFFRLLEEIFVCFVFLKCHDGIDVEIRITNAGGSKMKVLNIPKYLDILLAIAIIHFLSCTA